MIDEEGEEAGCLVAIMIACAVFLIVFLMATS